MTSTHRRSVGPANWLVPAALIALALLALAAFLWRRLPAAPQLVVEPISIDLGSLPLGTRASFEIRVANAGSGVLRFEQQPYIEVLEGC